MTTRQVRRAEKLAAHLAGSQFHGAPGPSIADIGGDVRRGWTAAFQPRGSHGTRGRRHDPSDTVEGWAGWLAAHIFPWSS